MDWEKKTASRAALQEAAADTFNEMLTPAQTLLRTLQDAEVARKERYYSTVSAKMKAAREKLPSLGVKHAPRSDNTIFTVPPPREVHSLQPNARPEKANMEGVREMLGQQMERHREVWDSFVSVRDGTLQQLQQEVGSVAAELKANLERDDECIEDIMSVLGEDRVMRLTEPEVYQVWDAVAQRVPERARWIEILGQALAEAEERRRVAVEGQLVVMVGEMAETAALSEGEIERILERESIGLNTSILQNRRAYADLVKRLQVAEVEAERQRRERWENALGSWRSLRSLHAMDLFNERIRSPEFAEPPERLMLYSRIREWQNKDAGRMFKHVEAVPRLLPPQLSSRRVTGWCDTAAKMIAKWMEETGQWLDRLLAHDDEVEQKGCAAYAQLTQEVLDYKGYPEEEARDLLEKSCGAVLQERREVSAALFKQSRKFLVWQADRWRHFSDALGSWLVQMCTMFEDHKTATSNNESNVRSTLKTRREQMNAEDAAREAALAAAIEAVSQGYNESHLDVQVTAALTRLDEIMEGYRSFHKAMSEIVHAFPCTVTQANEKYHWLLCTQTLVKPNMPTPEWALPPPPPTPPSPPVQPTTPESEKGSGAAGKAPAAKKKGGKFETIPEPPPPEPEPIPEPEPEPQPIKTFRLSDGSTFDLMKDLLEDLLSKSKAAQKVESEAAAEIEAAARAEAAVLAEAAAAEAAAAEAAAASAAASKPGAKRNLLKDQASSKKPGAVSGKAQSTEEPAPPPVIPPAPAKPEAITSPLSSTGAPHLRAIVLPLARFREVLEQLQVGMLREMAEFTVRTQSTAEEWSSEREGQLTEELDAHLRSHRPRAGRIEEETRLARSVELVAQRRKVEGHMAAQSKAVKAQAAQFEEWTSALKADTSKKIDRLHKYDIFLRQALSSKGVDIRKREAEALRARIERELAAKQAELEQLVITSCQQIVNANEAFASSELRTFQEGGHYSALNVQTYTASIGAINQHMDNARESQITGLNTLRGTLTQEADNALAYVSSLLPSFHEDMSLIEYLDELLETARKKARTELTRNTEAAAAINSELDKLEAVLIPATFHPASTPAGTQTTATSGKRGLFQQDSLKGQASTPRPASSETALVSACGKGAAAAGGVSFATQGAGVSGRDEEEEGGRGAMQPLVQCRAILESLASLRGMLLRQAKALDFLRSTGMVIEPVELFIEAASALIAQAEDVDSDNENRGGEIAFRPGAKKGADDAKSVKGGKEGAGESQSEMPGMAGSTAAAEGGLTLAEDIEAVIDMCKRDTEVRAREFYTALYPEGTAKAPPVKAPPKAKKKDGTPATPPDDTPQPIRPIRYPNRVPNTLEILLRQTDNVLDALREQLRQHLLVGVKELRTQVIRAYRLAEHAPAVAMTALTAHELQAAHQAQAEIRRRYSKQQAMLLAEIDDQRHTMHPSMILPSGRAHLERLKEREANRSKMFNEMLSAYAHEGVQGVAAQGPVIQQRLVHLVSLMLKLLDNFLMPDDVPPIKSDSSDDWVYALPGRKDDKQLHRLALANAEAEGVAEGGTEKADPKKKATPAAKGKAPPSPKDKAKEPEPPKKGDGETVPRPFGLLTWALPGGNLDLAALGWTNEEGSGLPVVPLQQEEPEHDPKETKASKSVKKPSSKGKDSEASKKDQQSPSPAVAATVAVSGLDTPCHRAGIRAYRASLQQVEAALCSALQSLRNEMLVWSKDEVLWQKTWGTLLGQLEGL